MRPVFLVLCAMWMVACQANGAAPIQPDVTAVRSPSPTLRFIVLGDTAYNGAEDEAEYARLIEVINDRRPEFSIHVGDTKGAGSCDDAFQLRIREGFARFDQPLVYTPGDNEWTDCHRPVNGGADPLDRLAAVRRIFFSDNESFGEQRIALQVQSQDFPENRMWEAANIQFATVHIVGSDNGRTNAAEFSAREAAGVAWMEEAFRRANERGAHALIIAFQAEIFKASDAEDGFTQSRETLRRLVSEHTFPVLTLHGDAHTFTFDRPFYRSASNGSVYEGENFYRLQSFGAPELGAVEVTVTPGEPAPFRISPILIR